MPIISWNRWKNARNLALGRPALSRFGDLTAAVFRTTYGDDDRIFVLGLLDGQVHAAVVLVQPNRFHVISLRRASRKERREYATRTPA